MQVPAVAKRWTVTAVLGDGDGDGDGVRYLRAGRALQSPIPAGPAPTPVEYLLIAVAGCFALSVRAAIAARDGSRPSLEVEAIGEKAADAPSRLGRIDVRVRLVEPVAGIDFGWILEEAKRLCTVTNTLRADPIIAVHIGSAPGNRPTAAA